MVNFAHNSDVIIGTMASQITSLTIIYSTVYSGADQRGKCSHLTKSARFRAINVGLASLGAKEFIEQWIPYKHAPGIWLVTV